MAQTKVKLVSNGVITVDNLHTNHGITTDHIGEGSVLYYTDARVQSYLTSNNYITNSDVANLETVTSLSLATNTLTYTDEAGNTTNIDLTPYLDYTASSWSSTTNNSANWDTAYSWGDHAGLYSLLGHAHTESDITDFGNYVTGITHDTVNTKLVVTNRDATTADISLTQYLDDTNLARLISGTLDGGTGVATFTRDDSSTFTVDFSAFLSDANDYVSSASFNTSDGVLTLTRFGGGTVTVDLDGKYAESVHTHVWTDITNRPTALSSFTNDLGNYGGFLTSFTETDPVFTASAASGITSTNISNWNTTYGWGDHAGAGYLTSYSETDTLATVTARGNSTTSIINGVDIRSQGQIRATGWYNTNSGTHTGLGTEIGVSGNQSFILSYNRDTSSYGVLKLNATQVVTDNSFRSPVFYDSNNTAYYLDPSTGGNSLSIAGNISMRSGKGIWLATSSDTNWQFGRNLINATGENLTSNTIQLKVYGQNVQGFQIVDHTGAARHEFGGTGAAYFQSSARAPIFYDSNDTNYYVDPNSTTRLAGLKANSIYNDSISSSVGSGWYTVAVTPTGRAFGTFVITDFTSGKHQSVKFTASSHYGNGNAIVMTHNDWYSGSPIRYIRIKRGGVYDGAMLQVYFDSSSNNSVVLNHNYQTHGWIMKNYVPDGTDPGNLNNFAALTNVAVLVDVDRGGRGGIIASGNAIGQSSVRGPVFYDLDDTGRYFDGSSTGDSIRVSGDIVAYYSDERLKDIKGNIDNPINKIKQLNGFYYTPNETAQKLGYKEKEQVGLSAQEVEKVLPQIIKDAPVGQGYKTLDYSKVVPLLVEGIKEQQTTIENLKEQIEELKSLINK